MLTEEQINNLHKLDYQTQLEILHECAEALGMIDIDEYCHDQSHIVLKIKKHYI